jgi:hypothetical protein
MGKFHYTWAVHVLLAMLEAWRNNRATEPTEFVLDYMSKDKGQREKREEIESIFENFAKKPQAVQRYGISEGCYSFRNRCEVTPLQASDLLAWSTMLRGHNQVTGKLPQDIAVEVYNTLKQSKRAFMAASNRNQLKQAVAQALKNPEYADEPFLSFKEGFPYGETRKQNPHPAA